ncbi:alpha/beta fold hydrolase [Zhongshania guokunii]|uniref:Alpha/beta fold hydrolase n=1 Tax=Zhongshania guokunii TaxID=641783 RepID=A0ABV3U8A0_9GAMM
MPRALSLHTEVSGDGDFPVILLHGLFGSASNLMSVARVLAADFKVVRMDLRNHGKSPHSDYMDIPSMAADVLATMDQLKIAKAHFLGHSLGGKVAMQVAVTHAERVDHLIVADIAPVRYGRGHDEIITALLGMDLRALRSREQAGELLQKAVPELAVRQFLLKNIARDGKDAWMWRMNLPVIAECYDNLRDAPNSESFDGPTLFIRGGLSKYIRDENRVPMQRQFPQMHMHTIDGAGHWLHAEYPQIFNSMVKDFLAADKAEV